VKASGSGTKVRVAALSTAGQKREQAGKRVSGGAAGGGRTRGFPFVHEVRESASAAGEKRERWRWLDSCVKSGAGGVFVRAQAAFSFVCEVGKARARW
jgi:hypothetical protein